MNPMPKFELDASHWDEDPYGGHRTTPEGWNLSDCPPAARRNGRVQTAANSPEPARETTEPETPHPTHEAFLEPRTMPKRWDLSEYF